MKHETNTDELNTSAEAGDETRELFADAIDEDAIDALSDTTVRLFSAILAAAGYDE